MARLAAARADVVRRRLVKDDAAQHACEVRAATSHAGSSGSPGPVVSANSVEPVTVWSESSAAMAASSSAGEREMMLATVVKPSATRPSWELGPSSHPGYRL